MTEAKFTPGPWDISKVGYIHKNGVMHPLSVDESRLEGESWIAMRKRLAPEFGEREAEAEANAHLIAAAPELYEALENLSGLFGTLITYDSDKHKAIADDVQAARAALAKARGDRSSRGAAECIPWKRKRCAAAPI